MRHLATAALTGWAVIMASGWVLADRRASRCPDTYNCAVSELGTRDAFLICGLLVPFMMALSFAILNARRGARIDLPTANLARPFLARTEVTTDIFSARKITTLLRGHWLPVAAMVGAAFALGWVSASGHIDQPKMHSDVDELDADARDAAANVSEMSEDSSTFGQSDVAEPASKAELVPEPVEGDLFRDSSTNTSAPSGVNDVRPELRPQSPKSVDN